MAVNVRACIAVQLACTCLSMPQKRQGVLDVYLDLWFSPLQTFMTVREICYNSTIFKGKDELWAKHATNHCAT